MRSDLKTGVLVVGHGSRRREANDDVRDAARAIAERGGLPLVEPAFLEIEHPNIRESFARLVERGAQEVLVHPYFLSPGRHTRGDIPVEVQAAAAEHPGVRFRISEPLSAHPLVISASVQRIRESISSLTVDKEGPDSIAYQAKPATVYLAAGRSPETPVVIRWGSWEAQQTVCGTLDSIADAADQAEMRTPAVIVIGEVVKLRERVQWFERTVKSSLWEDVELVATA